MSSMISYLHPPSDPISFLTCTMVLTCTVSMNLLCSVSLIDDGKNPDEFTRDVLNSCIAKDQITKGKTDAFKVWMHCIASIIAEIG